MSEKTCKIRKARKEDLNQIFQMIKELASFHGLSHKFRATKNSFKQSLFIDRKGPDVLIAEENGHPVGVVIFYQTFASFRGQEGIYIEDLYIRSKYRGKGYGRKLLQKVCKIAKKHLFKNILNPYVFGIRF